MIDDHVTYHLFTRENTERYINVDPSNPVELNTIKKIVFIIHGWTENRSRKWYNELKNALLRTGDVYVVQVDYEEPAAQDYVAAVLSVPDIGKFKKMLKVRKIRNCLLSLFSSCYLIKDKTRAPREPKCVTL